MILATGDLDRLDWAVIVLYFVAVFGVALVAAWRERTTHTTSAGYFLAGRNVGWFVIGASLFASNIGSEHLVGLAGAGASGQFPLGQYETQASLVILLLAWVFVPFYLRSGVYTMPEFLERRYSPATRWYLAIVCIVGYILTKISVTVFAGGIVFESVMGVDFWTGAIIVVIATGIYTIFGGLRAVLYTDMFQMFVLVGGSVVVLFAGLHALGGWDEMVRIAGSERLSLWRSAADPDFPWTGVVFGAPVVAIWYWCTDQFIVQRVLSARDIDQARFGSLWGAFIKQSALFIFVIPGVLAYCLVQTGYLKNFDPATRADAALPTLITQVLPTGLRGLVVAGLLAALMSSLSSVFNSCSTLVTIDVYKKWRPQASERQLVLAGQISTAILVGLGLAWIPFMKFISAQLYHYLQSVQAYISPPIAAVFLLGVFWRRVNAKGAMVSLVAGFILGMGRLVLELNKAYLGEGLLHRYATMNFMHVAVFLTLVCTALLVIVSLLTRPESDEKLAGLTYATAKADAAAAAAVAPSKRGLQILLSVLLVAIVVAILAYFRP